MRAKEERPPEVELAMKAYKDGFRQGADVVIDNTVEFLTKMKDEIKTTVEREESDGNGNDHAGDN